MNPNLEIPLDSQLRSESGYLIRWRGKQEGPYSDSVIDQKLAAYQIGLLHEIQISGRWITVRDFLVEKQAMVNAARQAQEEKERNQRDFSERRAHERDLQLREATLAEERRKNDLLASALEASTPSSGSASLSAIRPHRGGFILTLALVGLFIFGPLCIVAWVMATGDLRQMEAGTMDAAGRFSTRSGRNFGILGTVLWLIGGVIGGILLATLRI